MDQVVLLTPLVVLAVVLLLGFAGCGFEGRVGPPSLAFHARVPTTLVTTQVVFGWESPSTPRDQVIIDNPSPAFVDDPDNVFTHYLPLPLTDEGIPVSESWSVRCQVTVQGGATPGPAASGMFTVDGSGLIVKFQATGGAADLDLTFVGVV